MCCEDLSISDDKTRVSSGVARMSKLCGHSMGTLSA